MNYCAFRISLEEKISYWHIEINYNNMQLTIAKRWQHVEFTVILCEPKLVLIFATRNLTC